MLLLEIDLAGKYFNISKALKYWMVRISKLSQVGFQPYLCQTFLLKVLNKFRDIFKELKFSDLVQKEGNPLLSLVAECFILKVAPLLEINSSSAVPHSKVSQFILLT